MRCESYRLPTGVYLEHECHSYGVKGPSALPSIARAIHKRVEEVSQKEVRTLYVECDGVEYISVPCAQELVKILNDAQSGTVRIRIRRLMSHVLIAIERALVVEKLYLFVAEPDERQTGVLGEVTPGMKQCFQALSRQVNANPEQLARELGQHRSAADRNLQRLFAKGLVYRIELRGCTLYSILPLSTHPLLKGPLLRCYQLICEKPTSQSELSVMIGKSTNSVRKLLVALRKLALIQKDGTGKRAGVSSGRGPDLYSAL